MSVECKVSLDTGRIEIMKNPAHPGGFVKREIVQARKRAGEIKLAPFKAKPLDPQLAGRTT